MTKTSIFRRAVDDCGRMLAKTKPNILATIMKNTRASRAINELATSNTFAFEDMTNEDMEQIRGGGSSTVNIAMFGNGKQYLTLVKGGETIYDGPASGSYTFSI